MLVLVILFKHILPGVLLVALQQVLAAQLHSVFMLPDVLFIFVLLLLHYEDEHSEWVFISAFFLFLIQEYWSGQIVGIVPFYFLTFSYFYASIGNLFSKNLLLIPTSIVCFLGWVVFEFLVSLFLGIESSRYLFSYLSVLRFAVNIVLLGVLYMLINLFVLRKKESYE